METRSDVLLDMLRNDAAKLFDTSTQYAATPAASIYSRSSAFGDWQKAARREGIDDPPPRELLQKWVAADVDDFHRIEGQHESSAADQLAWNSSMHPSYAEILQAIDAKLAARIKPAAELMQVTNFLSTHMGKDRETIRGLVLSAPPELKALLSDERKMRQIDAQVRANLHWISPLQMNDFHAVVAHALKRGDAGERAYIAHTARAAFESEQTSGNAASVYSPYRMEREAREVADFIATNKALPPWKVAENVMRTAPELKAVLADQARMKAIEKQVNDQLAGISQLHIQEIQATIATALGRADAKERSRIVLDARAVLDLELKSDTPLRQARDAKAVADFIAASKGLFPWKIAENLIAASPELKALLRDEARMKLLGPQINERLGGHISDIEDVQAVVASTLISDASAPRPEQRAAAPDKAGEQEPQRKAMDTASQAANADPEEAPSADIPPLQERDVVHAAEQPRPAPCEDAEAAPLAAMVTAAPDLPHPTKPPGTPLPSPVETSQNGFSSGGPLSADQPIEPMIGKVLESMTYKAQRDGSVLYLIDNRPAFVDHGHQILMAKEADKDEKSILAALLMAKEKYGGTFDLTGDNDFKRRAIEVMLKYRINAKLKSPEQDALRRDIAAELAKAATPPPQSGPVAPIDLKAALLARDDLAAQVDADSAMATAPAPAPTPAQPILADEPVNRLAGKVIRHGGAPYDHIPDNKISYFVELENSDGRTRTIWGIDLERVMNNAAVNKGDQVVLQNLGRRPVEVDQFIRDEAGKIISSEKIIAHRNEWEVEIVQRTDIPDQLREAKHAPADNPARPTAIRAEEWWLSQQSIIRHAAKNEQDLRDELELHGPGPASDQVFWFDESGHPCAPPSGALPAATAEQAKPDRSTPEAGGPQERYELHGLDSVKPDFFSSPDEAIRAADKRGLTSFLIVGADMHTTVAYKAAGVWHRENGSLLNPPPGAARQRSEPAKIEPVLIGVKKIRDKQHEIVLALHKGLGDYLQGHLKIGDQKHQVLALLPGLPADGKQITDAVPITLSIRAGSASAPVWKKLGHGLAVNSRKSDKPVYFDEVVFKVGKDTITARVHPNADNALRQKMGFMKNRENRPNPGISDVPLRETDSPKPAERIDKPNTVPMAKPTAPRRRQAAKA